MSILKERADGRGDDTEEVNLGDRYLLSRKEETRLGGQQYPVLCDGQD